MIGIPNQIIYFGRMKITVPEGEKAQIVNAICKFIGFKTEGVIEAGAVDYCFSAFIGIGIFV